MTTFFRKSLFFCLVLVSGCSGFNDKRICESEMSSKLINPETAEFLEFKKIDFNDWQEMLSSKFSRDNGGYGASTVKEGLEKFREGNFYYSRMKADGKLGNSITSIKACRVVSDSCECVDIE